MAQLLLPCVCVSLQRTLQVCVCCCSVKGTREAGLSGMFINRRPAKENVVLYTVMLYSAGEKEMSSAGEWMEPKSVILRRVGRLCRVSS